MKCPTQTGLKRMRKKTDIHEVNKISVFIFHLNYDLFLIGTLIFLNIIYFVVALFRLA